MPAAFIVMERAGASAWEILAQRIVWGTPLAALLVVGARQGAEVRNLLTRPKALGWLALSTLLIGVNWTIFVWAVTHARTLDASLGYYINPLLNMAAGAILFRERIDRIGWTAIALATAGVALQALALGGLPLISLALAVSFCGYGLVRKHVAASAQTGLFVECLILFPMGLAYAGWLWVHGAGVFGRGLSNSLLMMLAGPVTVVPLALFAWAARRLAFSTIGFLQFISPTLGFATGLETGETLTPARAASFAVIWIGATVFVFAAWRANRSFQGAPAAASKTGVGGLDQAPGPGVGDEFGGLAVHHIGAREAALGVGEGARAAPAGVAEALAARTVEP
jgi:chloramphenicol-sensitive protein RarD